MIYVTTRQKPIEKQISWLDIINEEENKDLFATGGSAGTITRTMEEPTEELLSKISVPDMISTLKTFNAKHKALFEADRKSLYRHFKIAKRSGGLRDIDAPNDELQDALRELANIITKKFGVLYHTSAYAYITGRSTTQDVRKHQINNSNWFYKTDCSGFFPNTTLEFTMRMLSMIFPLSEICKVEEGKEELKKAISLGFLNGGLPQGTCLSPVLTNCICIPIDHRMFNELAHHRYVYTRYADDIHISCIQKFDERKMTNFVNKVFKEFDAPWNLKPEKTHFGSRKGKNWMLGVCLNKDNNITVGYRNKATFKAMTANLIQDYKHGKFWPAEDVKHYEGLLSYYTMVEPDYFNQTIKHLNNKFHVSVHDIIKNSMRMITF